MSWIADRLKERVSQAAIAAALLAVSSVASQPAAWAPGGLALWLGLVQPIIIALIAVLVPEGAPQSVALNPLFRATAVPVSAPRPDTMPPPGAAVLVALLAVGALSACTPQPPATTLFEARAAYDAAYLVPIVHYHGLPVCPQPGPDIACRDVDIDAQLIKADTTAKTALDTAETMIRIHPGSDPAALIADAQAAVEAVRSILITYDIIRD